MSSLPEKTRHFSDELEITTIDGESFVNVYCNRAGPDYCTYAHQPDTASSDVFSRPEKGILNACHDIGVFMGWGMLPTSILGAFHAFDVCKARGRQWIAMNSAFIGSRFPEFPGILSAWNADATDSSDIGYYGFRDVGDPELYGSASSLQKVRYSNPYGHPEPVMQKLYYANCFIEDILVALFVRSRLRQYQDDYHFDNPETIEQTAKFFESAIMELLSGMKSASPSPTPTVALPDMLNLDDEMYHHWLTRSAEEIVYWTTKQPSKTDDPDSY